MRKIVLTDVNPDIAAKITEIAAHLHTANSLDVDLAVKTAVAMYVKVNHALVAAANKELGND